MSVRNQEFVNDHIQASQGKADMGCENGAYSLIIKARSARFPVPQSIEEKLTLVSSEF
jgi:hypothetical protein